MNGRFVCCGGKVIIGRGVVMGRAVIGALVAGGGRVNKFPAWPEVDEVMAISEHP